MQVDVFLDPCAGARRAGWRVSRSGEAAGVWEKRSRRITTGPAFKGFPWISWTSVRARLPRPWRAERRKRQAAQLRQRSRRRRVDRRRCPGHIRSMARVALMSVNGSPDTRTRSCALPGGDASLGRRGLNGPCRGFSRGTGQGLRGLMPAGQGGTLKQWKIKMFVLQDV